MITNLHMIAVTATVEALKTYHKNHFRCKSLLILAFQIWYLTAMQKNILQKSKDKQACFILPQLFFAYTVGWSIVILIWTKDTNTKKKTKNNQLF